MSGNGSRKPPRPRIELVAGNPTEEEGAAIVAALEQFLAETAPAPAARQESRWQRAALAEGVNRDPGGALGRVAPERDELMERSWSPAAPASWAPTSRSRWPGRRPGGARARQPAPPRLRAEPAAARDGRGRVRARRRARARRLERLPQLDAIVECSAEPSVMSGIDGRHLLPRAHQPHRRLQLPRAGAPRRRRDACSSPPAASIRSRRWRRSALEEEPTRFEIAERAGDGGRLAGGHLGAAFRLGGARTLYGTTKLAAELLIDEYRARLRPARGHRPLRRDRRALADGQGRPGRVHPLDAQPPLPAAAALHRLRR